VAFIFLLAPSGEARAAPNSEALPWPLALLVSLVGCLLPFAIAFPEAARAEGKAIPLSLGVSSLVDFSSGFYFIFFSLFGLLEGTSQLRI
jgi:hypothetical protein